MSSTAQPIGPAADPTRTDATQRVLPGEVYDLFARLKELEDRYGCWPGADTVSVLDEWFTGLGVDPTAVLADYAAATAPGPEGTVYLVERDTIDGLYLFVDEDQAASTQPSTRAPTPGRRPSSTAPPAPS